MQTDLCFPQLYGNEKLKSILGDEIARGAFSHAYILEGPEGSGKKTAASLIASSIVCEEAGHKDQMPCGKCLSCRKILGGFSPDYVTVDDPAHASIGVETVRSVKENLYIPPNDGEMKFYVFPHAEKMTIQAQNALLLSLEEPPPFVFFLLLTTGAESLLPTIRSRAPVLTMQKFRPSEIRSYLSAHPELLGGENDETLRKMASLGGGTIGQTLEALKDKTRKKSVLALRDLAVRVSEALLTSDREKQVRILGEIPKKERSQVLKLTDEVLRILRDDLVYRKSPQNLQFFTDISEIPDSVRMIPSSRILAAFDRVAKAREDLERNGSVTLILADLLLGKKNADSTR